MENKIECEKNELIRLVREVTKTYALDNELRICGIQDNLIHFAELSGFKKFIGIENFNKVTTKQNNSAAKSNWIELIYVVDEITAIVLI